jgi:FixJ family two-component response regulator
MEIAEQHAGGAEPGVTIRRPISIVDDDASIREALKGLMRSVNLHAEAFASAEEFLASERLNDTSCLILDLYLPGMNGFELQQRLKAEGRAIPIIFITAHADEVARERALSSGAVDLLAKPVRRDPLFKAMRAAMDL